MATTRKATSKQAKELISAPAIFRATDKSGAFLGYGVPSKSEAHKTYHVTWNEVWCCWDCDCDGNAKWHRTCDHIKAVASVCRERKAFDKMPCPCEEAKEIAAATPVQAKKPAPRQWENWDEMASVPAKPAEIAAIFVSAAHTFNQDPVKFVEMAAAAKRREEAPLHNNQGFSVLRR